MDRESVFGLHKELIVTKDFPDKDEATIESLQQRVLAGYDGLSSSDREWVQEKMESWLTQYMMMGGTTGCGCSTPDGKKPDCGSCSKQLYE